MGRVAFVFFFVKSFSSLRLRFAYFSAIFNTILFNVFQFDFETIFDNCLALCGQCTVKRMNRRYVQTTYPDAGIQMNGSNWMSDLDAFIVTCFGMILIRTINIELSLFKMNSIDEQDTEKSEFCCHTHRFTWSSAQIAKRDSSLNLTEIVDVMASESSWLVLQSRKKRIQRMDHANVSIDVQNSK